MRASRMERSGGRGRCRLGAGVLCAGLVLGVALGPAAVDPSSVGVAEASPQVQRYRLVLGLKDPALRTEAGVKALRTRVRARLLAAGVVSSRLDIDALHHELKVEVVTRLSLDDVRRMLIAAGSLEVMPVVEESPQVWRQLKGVLALPEGVEWQTKQLAGGGSELFLVSDDGGLLERVAQKVALANYQVLVMATPHNDADAPYRSWLVSTRGPKLGGAGLGGATVIAHTYPNFHSVRMQWDLLTSGVGEGAGAKRDALGGAEGLRRVTAAARGGRVAVVVDGQPVAVVPTAEPVDDGALVLPMPPGSEQFQRRLARLIAGRLASQPHPCPVVVVRSEVAR